MKDLFAEFANCNIRLMAHRALDDELPRGMIPLGQYGGYDLPDTLGLADQLREERDVPGILAWVDQMTVDEVIVLPLMDFDFYLVIYGTNPVPE